MVLSPRTVMILEWVVCVFFGVLFDDGLIDVFFRFPFDQDHICFEVTFVFKMKASAKEGRVSLFSK